MAFDKDWMKVMGDDFVPLNADQVVDETPVVDAAIADAPTETEAPSEVAPEEVETPVAEETPQETQPVEEEKPELDGESPTVEEQATEEPSTEETPQEEEKESGEETPEEEMDAGQKLIDELLGQVEKTTEEKNEEGEKLEEAIEKTGDEDLKKQLEEYRLKEEQLESKVASVTSEYRKLLDKNNTLEAINDEYTAKMRIISDNPLLQDLLRGLYLQGENPTSLSDLESTLKRMLKEYTQIDVDDLAAKTREASAESLSPSDAGAVVGENTVYKGLLEEGDIVPLNSGE